MPKGDCKNLRADLDDGFARLANLVIEALACAPLTGSQFRVVMLIIRRTYGWARAGRRDSGKTDIITADEVARGTGLPRRTVEDAVAELAHARVILSEVVTADNRRKYGLNPDVSAWGTPTAKWVSFQSTLRSAREAYTYGPVHIYGDARTPVRNPTYSSTEESVQGVGAEAPEMPVEAPEPVPTDIFEAQTNITENASPPKPPSRLLTWEADPPDGNDTPTADGSAGTDNISLLNDDGTPQDAHAIGNNNGAIYEAVRRNTRDEVWSQPQRSNLAICLAQACGDPPTDITEPELLKLIPAMQPSMNERRLPEKYLDRLLKAKAPARASPRASPHTKTMPVSPDDAFDPEAFKRSWEEPPDG